MERNQCLATAVGDGDRSPEGGFRNGLAGVLQSFRAALNQAARCRDEAGADDGLLLVRRVLSAATSV